jgi:hypothetical protein
MCCAGGQNDPRQPAYHGAAAFQPLLYRPLHPGSKLLLAYQTRIKPLENALINGMRVHRPKDLAKMANRTSRPASRELSR